MKIEGCSGQEIADAIGVEKRTVYLWFSDGLVKGELERQRGQVFELFASRLLDVGMQAIRRLEELSELPLEQTHLTVEQRIAVTQEILDRIPMTAKQQHRTPSSPLPADNNLPPEDMTDQDLLAEFQRVAGELPAGVIDGVLSGNGNGP